MIILYSRNLKLIKWFFLVSKVSKILISVTKIEKNVKFAHLRIQKKVKMLPLVSRSSKMSSLVFKINKMLFQVVNICKITKTIALLQITIKKL